MDQSKKPVVLIVDDQPELVAVMSMYFRHYGYTFFTATSAVEAHQVLENQKIDLVVCDMLMPVESGLDFFKQVREKDPEKPYFIFCSGLCDVPFTKPYPSGVIGFLHKPYSMMDLMDAVEVYFNDTVTT